MNESGFDTDAESGKEMDIAGRVLLVQKKTDYEGTKVDKRKEWKNFLQKNHMSKSEMPFEYFKNLQSVANINVNETKKKSKVIV